RDLRPARPRLSRSPQARAHAPGRHRRSPRSPATAPTGQRRRRPRGRRAQGSGTPLVGLRGGGVCLPAVAGEHGGTGAELAAFARRAEDLGFDSVWATDHLLHQSRFYAVPWLDPIVSPTDVAGHTAELPRGDPVRGLP